ncbi:hypothetical protein Pogu_2221 [Pyrobaculum oguniense TE7]|uniref:Uncharacterized protein n=1 Tax=Pyrobaculum oguniense (strain DSM 13380 / JCM 10595 / TE7) TaxID=698757 RepID=H6QBH2_PYROT|nr:hypothetical protein Pogu_2221 [Pyrobaculum oguniense TE7]
MLCGDELCFTAELVHFERPPEKIEIDAEGAVAICVRKEAVAHWRELLQALYYAYSWRGPARNPNISALLFLAKTSQIKDALRISAAGASEAICAALGPAEALKKAEMPRGEPHLPEGRWDPWAITKFAIDLLQ